MSHFTQAQVSFMIKILRLLLSFQLKMMTKIMEYMWVSKY